MENVDSTLSLTIETSRPLTPDPTSPIASLFFLGNNELASRSFLLYPGLNYIGRNPSSRIFLPCRNLSRNHACIIHQMGSNFLFDCHSHNGSFRWNVPLLPDFRYELINGTEFTLANLSFRFLPLSDYALISPFSYEHINNSSNLIFTSDEDEISMNIPTESKPELTLLSSDRQINTREDESPCANTTQIVSESIIDKTMSVASPNIHLSTFFIDNSLKSPFNGKDNVHDLREFKTSSMYACEFCVKYYTIILSNIFKGELQNGHDNLNFNYSKFSKSTFISNGFAFSIREDIIDFSLINNFDKYFDLLISSNFIYLDHLQQFKLNKNSDVESIATIFEDYIVENDSHTVSDCVDKYMVINCDNTPLNSIEKSERTDIQSCTIEELRLPIFVSQDFEINSQDSISKTPSMNEDLICPISDKYFDFSSNIPHISFTYLMDSKYRFVVNSLGGILEIDINKTTHLITDKIRRTFKFLCCLARGCEILSVDWLSKSRKAGRFVLILLCIRETRVSFANLSF